MSRIPVGIVGATGLAGQQFLASLSSHPMFEVRKLAASSRSAGKKYAQAIRDDKGASRWFCSEPLHPEFMDITVEDSASFTARWAGRIWMTRTADRIFEYACHEGNYSMVGILRGARAMERKDR